MPTYNYKCDNENCKNHDVFEITKGINEEAPTECPECGSSIKRVFGATPNVWKCGGAYVTNYR